jgi:large subunit ribosomal protein L35
MPKLKTHQGMAKRIKVTGSGKLLRRRAYRGHLLGGKQASLKRTYVKEFQVADGDASNVKRMIGSK